MSYNIIFYFTDQQRWDTCGCFGQPLDITPNLDRLAREGVKFDLTKIESPLYPTACIGAFGIADIVKIPI